MKYVSSVERIGIEKGVQQGSRQGSLSLLCHLISKRFKAAPYRVQPILNGLDHEQIEELGERFLDAKNLGELRRWAEEKRTEGTGSGQAKLLISMP